MRHSQQTYSSFALNQRMPKGTLGYKSLYSSIASGDSRICSCCQFNDGNGIVGRVIRADCEISTHCKHFGQNMKQSVAIKE